MKGDGESVKGIGVNSGEETVRAGQYDRRSGRRREHWSEWAYGAMLLGGSLCRAVGSRSVSQRQSSSQAVKQSSGPIGQALWHSVYWPVGSNQGFGEASTTKKPQSNEE